MSATDTRLETAIRITAEAARISLSHFRGAPEIEAKADQSPVTEADKATELAIRKGLATHFPGERVFGEEFGDTAAANGSVNDPGTSDDAQGGAGMWIIDPIDGTRSFITGSPLFGMLLGYLSGDSVELGVIRMPVLDEVYAGGRGVAATWNGTPINVSACRRLDEARLFINEADKLATREPQVLDRLVRAGQLRRMGADCHPHALVAHGLVDAVVDYDLQPYDYLPVSAVVHAAGGVMTDWHGQPLGMSSDGRTLTAATPELHSELMTLVSQP